MLVSFTATRPMVFDPEVVARRPDGGAVAWNVTADFQSVQAWPGAAFGADGVAYVGVIDELYALEAQ
jgi:hypothetical protein